MTHIATSPGLRIRRDPSATTHPISRNIASNKELAVDRPTLYVHVYVFVSEPLCRNEATDFLGGSRTTDTPNVFALTVPEKTRLAVDARKKARI